MNDISKEENQNIRENFDNMIIRDADQKEPNLKKINMLKFCKENSAKQFEDNTIQFLNLGKLIVL